MLQLIFGDGCRPERACAAVLHARFGIAGPVPSGMVPRNKKYQLFHNGTVDIFVRSALVRAWAGNSLVRHEVAQNGQDEVELASHTGLLHARVS